MLGSGTAMEPRLLDLADAAATTEAVQAAAAPQR
jgi:hypothetical protein